jgi:hypothetical protein
LQQVISSEDGFGATFEEYCACLCQAFALTSVSVYFRQVAFPTPDYFRMKVKGIGLAPEDWPQELREELESIVGTHQIEITWGGGRMVS